MARVPYFLAQLVVVLDYAVVNDGEPPRAVEVRVGVALGDPAVGCPAGVSEARVAFGHTDLGAPYLAHLLLGEYAAVVTDGDPPGVVATVLQPAEPVENHAGRVGLAPGIRKDAAQSGNLRTSAGNYQRPM